MGNTNSQARGLSFDKPNQHTAAEKVGSVVELRLAFLSNLPPRKIILYRRVSKDWQTSVDNDSGLQQLVFNKAFTIDQNTYQQTFNYESAWSITRLSPPPAYRRSTDTRVVTNPALNHIIVLSSKGCDIEHDELPEWLLSKIWSPRNCLFKVIPLSAATTAVRKQMMNLAAGNDDLACPSSSWKNMLLCQPPVQIVVVRSINFGGDWIVSNATGIRIVDVLRILKDAVLSSQQPQDSDPMVVDLLIPLYDDNGVIARNRDDAELFQCLETPLFCRLKGSRCEEEP